MDEGQHNVFAYKEEGKTQKLRNGSMLESEAAQRGNRVIGFFHRKDMIDWVARR